MYRNNKYKSSQNYWYEFCDTREQEELYEKINSMIEDKIHEILPLYVNQISDAIIRNIESYLNFKIIDYSGLKDEIIKQIEKISIK